MINIGIITIEGRKGKREIYVSPFLLNEEELANIKPGKIMKLYLYDDLKDERYFANMPAEVSKALNRLSSDEPDEFWRRKRNFRKTVVYYGQNFEPYLLGVFHIDFDKKEYANWKGTSEAFGEEDLKLVTEHLFQEDREHDYRTIMQLTVPSDIKIARLRK